MNVQRPASLIPAPRRSVVARLAMLVLFAGCAGSAGDGAEADETRGEDVAATTSALEAGAYCYLPNETRAVGTVADSCPPGEEKDGAFCYPTCEEGYDGVANVCWQQCDEDEGEYDIGLWCQKGELHIFTKDSYGRGAGTTPDSCRSGEEKSGSLCYPKCKTGYYGVGPVCWQKCPSGYKDDGAFCRRDVVIINSDTSSCPWYDVCGVTFAKGCSKCPSGYINDGCTCRKNAHIFAKDSYGRGAGTTLVCSSTKQYDAGLCYSKCNAGYKGVGPVCWQVCPYGYADDGLLCRRPPEYQYPKDFYERETRSLGCRPGFQYDAGLCYEYCPSDTVGVGPVCWGYCPSDMVPCGAGCARSGDECANVIIGQILSVGEVAFNLASFMGSLGSSTLVTTGVKAAMTQAQKLTLKQALAAGMREASDQAGQQVALEVIEVTAEHLTDAAEKGEFDPRDFDPTGISAMILAFGHPVCEP